MKFLFAELPTIFDRWSFDHDHLHITIGPSWSSTSVHHRTYYNDRTFPYSSSPSIAGWFSSLSSQEAKFVPAGQLSSSSTLGFESPTAHSIAWHGHAKTKLSVQETTYGWAPFSKRLVHIWIRRNTFWSWLVLGHISRYTKASLAVGLILVGFASYLVSCHVFNWTTPIKEC